MSPTLAHMFAVSDSGSFRGQKHLNFGIKQICLIPTTAKPDLRNEDDLLHFSNQTTLSSECHVIL